ncbi:MAG: hypothetical protein J6L91_07460 [Clostridia bacterium]|nr:hypothetical protein [Clostridia bacterium]
MKTVVKLNVANINRVEQYLSKALIETGDAVKTDLMQSQTMPFDTGALQNRSTFVDSSQAKRGKVYVVSDEPYARRLYFHPEYNFQTTNNPNAGAEWFEPYISGAKKDYAQKVFTAFMRSKTGG